jgi:ferredoxin-NADP reductase
LNGKRISFLPGQFVFLYVNFENKGKIEGERRAFSIASSPLNNSFIELTLKRNPNGKVTPYFLDKVKIGDCFEISNPMGKFTYSKNLGENIVLIAGGSGIVPMKSIMRYCTDEKLDTKITLLYSAKRPEDIIYKEELKELEKTNHNIKIAYTMTQVDRSKWKGYIGRIDKDFILKNVKNITESIYYLCGPLGFIRDIASILKELGVDRRQIKRDVWI